MQQCSTHLSEQFIKSSVGKKGTPNPPPPKKNNMAIFLSKTRCVYLNGTKQFCLGKVKLKAIPSVIQLTRVTYELTVQRPLVIGGTFLFLVIGLPVKASSYLRRHWWKSSGWWRSLDASTVCSCWERLLYMQGWWNHCLWTTIESSRVVSWLLGSSSRQVLNWSHQADHSVKTF